MKDQPISTLMHARVDAISMDMSVSEVEAFFAGHHLSWAPVVADNGGVVGVRINADLIRQHTQGRDPDKKKTWQISTYRPLCVDPQTTISATARMMVERQGQKKILIGENGERIKNIGREARLEMERAFDAKVMLNLWVKVKRGWSDDERALKSLGYTHDKD